MPIEIKTPCARVVWGNPGKSQIKLDMTTKKPKLNKENQPVNQWAFGIAIPKEEFKHHVWPAMAQEAASGYPNGTPPKFAWKYQDGDGIDSNGQPFNKREGYAGCFVLTVSSEAFAPPIYKFVNGAYVQLQPDQIKTGDYVVVAIKFQVNVPQQNTFTPGLYVNPVAIEHVGYGTEIQNGPDPMTLFGGTQRQLPPGASATPLAPAHNVGMPGTGGPGPQMHQQPMQQPGQMPGQMQPGGPQPGYPQAGPGYAPQPDPRFTGGGMPNGAPNPGMPQHQPHMQQPMQQPNGYPPNNGQPGPGQHVQPAHDFVQNAGQQQPGGYAPQHQQPQYAPPPNGQPPYQPNPGMMQPGQMPGMPPNR